VLAPFRASSKENGARGTASSNAHLQKRVGELLSAWKEKTSVHKKTSVGGAKKLRTALKKKKVLEKGSPAGGRNRGGGGCVQRGAGARQAPSLKGKATCLAGERGSLRGEGRGRGGGRSGGVKRAKAKKMVT